MNIMRFKVWYFIFSFLIILPGLYYLFSSGLKLGIDFTGGALLEYKLSLPPQSGGRLQGTVDSGQLKKSISDQGIEVGQIISTSDNTYIIRTKPLDQEHINKIKSVLIEKYGQAEERRVENVGPVIGEELKRKSITALIVASIFIVLYIAFSFRQVSKPASSWRFGITAIVALFHDILLIIGVFAILGKFLGVEVDTLFV